MSQNSNNLNMLDLLIQIINYNTKKYLEQCLESLFMDIADIGINYKVVVLDNNSDDDLSDLQKKYEYSRISFVKSEINYGFGGGHNAISQIEESRYMLILNSDLMFIEKNSVKRLYDRLKENDRYSVIGPRLVVEDNSQQEFDHGELRGIASWVKNNYGSSYWKPRKSQTEAAWVSVAVFMCSTAVFKHVGGFDEKFFLYKEEEDLCRRIRDNGHRILYYPEVTVMHIGHVVARRSKHFTDSMNYYIEKHFKNKLSYKILNAVKVTKDLALYGKIRERT